jgi:hypothetical protein
MYIAGVDDPKINYEFDHGIRTDGAMISMKFFKRSKATEGT